MSLCSCLDVCYDLMVYIKSGEYPVLNKTLIIASVFLLLLSGSCYAIYRYSSDKFYRNGYADGYREAPKPDISRDQVNSLSEQLKSSQAAYTSLQKDYNDFRQKVINYVGVSAVPKSSVHCSSSTYGINSQFASTDCY